MRICRESSLLKGLVPEVVLHLRREFSLNGSMKYDYCLEAGSEIEFSKWKELIQQELEKVRMIR